jgi:hypothetical protein
MTERLADSGRRGRGGTREREGRWPPAYWQSQTASANQSPVLWTSVTPVLLIISRTFSSWEGAWAAARQPLAASINEGASDGHVELLISHSVPARQGPGREDVSSPAGTATGADASSRTRPQGWNRSAAPMPSSNVGGGELQLQADRSPSAPPALRIPHVL